MWNHNYITSVHIYWLQQYQNKAEPLYRRAGCTNTVSSLASDKNNVQPPPFFYLPSPKFCCIWHMWVGVPSHSLFPWCSKFIPRVYPLAEWENVRLSLGWRRQNAKLDRAISECWSGTYSWFRAPHMYVTLRAEGLLLVCGGRYKSLHFRTVVPECKGWRLGG